MVMERFQECQSKEGRGCIPEERRDKNLLRKENENPFLTT
jgi:hypothetical protein